MCEQGRAGAKTVMFSFRETVVRLFHNDHIVVFLFHYYSFHSCRADCEHFEMEIPEFSTADELRVDLESFEKMWSMYDTFNSGLNDLAKEDWISFR